MFLCREVRRGMWGKKWITSVYNGKFAVLILIFSGSPAMDVKRIP
jgi:hypothetical protein